MAVIIAQDMIARPSSAHREEEEVPIALMPIIPPLKFHGAPYYFMSEPGITQQEYQRRVIARGDRFDPHENELITVKCPDKEDGAGRVFRFQRAVLQRSPILNQFFNSRYYIPGCDMRLTFVVDPAICLEIVYDYLQAGPDLFRQTVLRVRLTMRFKVVDRAVILLRLYALAQKLDLPGLMDLAFGVLIDGDKLIKPDDCVTLASLIFAPHADFDAKLKDWCISHVRRNAKELQHARIWQQVGSKVDKDLTQRWAELMELKPERLDPVDEALEDAQMRTNLDLTFGPASPLPRPAAASKEESFQYTLDEVALKHRPGTESDEEWNLSEALAATSPRSRSGSDFKIAQILGPVENTDKPSSPGFKREASRPRGMTPSPSSMFSPSHDKARFIIGYPGESMGVNGVGYGTPHPTPTKTARMTKLWAGH
ncbi:MAG: hypothetical protein Q9210_006922 [Variospora velana]